MTRPVNPPTKYPYFYLPDGWDAGWKAAKANAAGGAIGNILIVGDSILSGTAPCTKFSKTAGELLFAALLAQGYPRYADYYPAYLSPSTGSLTDPPWVTAASEMQQVQTFGWHGTNISSAAQTAANRLIFTSPYACTAMDIYYCDVYPGTWQYNIDGGSQVTITNASAALSQANYQTKKIALTGLANAIHTLNFGNASALGSLNILGVTTYTGNAGGLGYARFINSGQIGGQYFGSPTASYPANRTQLFSNKSPQNDATAPGSGTFTGFPLTNIGLVINELAINDATNLGTPSVTPWNVMRFIRDGFAFPNPTCSYLQIIVCPDEVHDAAQYLPPASWAPFVDVIKRSAIAGGWATLDLDTKWRYQGEALGFLTAGNVHPTDAGEADMANTLLTVL